MPESTPNNRLRIKQQNCKHSKEITLTLINTTDPYDWDLVLLQEPYIYPSHNLLQPLSTGTLYTRFKITRTIAIPDPSH
jgi:hypothetical protein